MNTPSPLDAPPKAPPAEVVTPAMPSPAPIRSPMSDALILGPRVADVPCSLLRVGAGSRVSLAGLVGTGDPAASLRKTADTAVPAGVDWQVRAVDSIYCPVLDLLNTLPGPSSGLSVDQDGGASSLADNQIIGLHVTMPSFAGFLHLAYIQSNATVSPLVPSVDYPSQTYVARASIGLGQPRGSFAGWRAGPPFGTDMVVAVVSTAPLFTRPPAEDQPLATYLTNLDSAIQTLRRRGGSVNAAATIIETKPGPATPATR